MLAPQNEQSATGMKLTLSSGMQFTERKISLKLSESRVVPAQNVLARWRPCDCVIVALGGGLKSWAPEIDPSFASLELTTAPIYLSMYFIQVPYPSQRGVPVRDASDCHQPSDIQPQKLRGHS